MSRGRSRRRNGMMGTTLAEHQHAGWNPRHEHFRRGALAAGGNRSGVLLGRLSELVVEDSQGLLRPTPAALKGLYVAWFPSGDDLGIVRLRGGRPGPLSVQVRNIHTRFHQAPPRSAVTFDRPTQGPWKRVGLLRTLSYIVPEHIVSPGKKGANWVHHFGDHGERGHGPMTEDGDPGYSDSLKPMLLENAKGEMRIQRRPGNKYDVTEWIYW